MCSRGATALVVSLAMGLLVAFVPGAGAADFELSSQGCVRDLGASSACAQQMQGLGGSAAVAVSPDGTSVYVASFSDGTIAHLQRNPTTGKLTPVDCVADAGNPICGPGNTSPALGGVNDVIVSPDGKSVYAVSQTDDAIVQLIRNTTTGTLTPHGCIEDSGAPDSGCPANTEGLNGADAVAVTPNGRDVFVASKDDNAIAHFFRAPGSADPTNLDFPTTPCQFADVDHPLGGCGGSADGLDGAQDLAFSPDGSSLYVASRTDSAVARFDQSAGTLTAKGCIADPSGDAGCSETQNGLAGAQAAVVSPEGNSVYVAGLNSSAIAVFDRATFGLTRGELTGLLCVSDEGKAGCASHQQGLDTVFDLAVSPDGESLYAVSFGDDALVRFGRDPSGSVLTGRGCVDDSAVPIGCAQTASALMGGEGVAVSPEGNSVYTAAISDSAVSLFRRAPVDTTPPRTTITSGPSGTTSDPTPTFAFASNEPGSTFQCRLDGAPFASCSSPKTLGPLADGAHTFRVRATDRAGNSDPTPAARTFTVAASGGGDTTPPQTTIKKKPPKKTAKRTARFKVHSSEPGSSFACRLDRKPWKPCRRSQRYRHLKRGRHVFRVRATDAAGNTDRTPAKYRWKVKR